MWANSLNLVLSDEMLLSLTHPVEMILSPSLILIRQHHKVQQTETSPSLLWQTKTL